MIGALSTLLLYQLAGELLARSLELKVPGPVLGMLMLFLTLWWRGRVGPSLEGTAQQLVQHLSLLFVPAGTGVMLHLDRIGNEWLPIAVSLVVSTVIALAVTALVLRLLTRSHGPSEQAPVEKTP